MSDVMPVLQILGWVLFGLPVLSLVLVFYGFIFGFPLSVFKEFRANLQEQRSTKSFVFLFFLPLSAIYFGVIKPSKPGLRPIAALWASCIAGLGLLLASGYQGEIDKKIASAQEKSERNLASPDPSAK